jgi:hypothetical protein
MRPSLDTVARVLARAGWGCERCGVDLQGARGSGWSIHHRRPRGMGGTRRPDTNSPANLLAVCGSGNTACHGEIESNRAHAQENGWLVPQVLNPAEVAVLICGERWRYLNELGDYVTEPANV